MYVLGLAGWSGSGKTTLLAKLIPLFTAQGIAVSTIKHAHHDFDVDQPGKDSWVHRQAGAAEVLVASSRRFALMREFRGAPEPNLAELLAKMRPVDIILVEGFKRDPIPKIEVYRPELGKAPLYRDDDRVIAVASPTQIDTELPWMPLNAPDVIAAFIMEQANIARRS
jgi:molybdopterin-guanine dinucleotide biosynthesis protein MobB